MNQLPPPTLPPPASDGSFAPPSGPPGAVPPPPPPPVPLFATPSVAAPAEPAAPPPPPPPMPPAVIEPSPVAPTPVAPTPVEPAVVEPMPVAPIPVEPAVIEPTPIAPAPVEPSPVAPPTPALLATAPPAADEHGSLAASTVSTEPTEPTGSPVPVSQESSGPSVAPDSRRARTPAALLIAGLGLAAVAGGGWYLMSRGSDEPATLEEAPIVTDAPTDEPPAATIPAGTDAPTPTSAPAAVPEPTTPATAPATTAPATTAPATTAPPTTAPATTAPATVPVVDEPSADEVPESKAIVRNGQIFLEGAVPTAEAGEAIAALAAEILGPDNVFNGYVVDPRAGDPNLGNITVEDTINFATGSSEILPGSETLLNQGLALFTIRPTMTMIAVGHTDDRGSDEYNQQLSLARAEAVVEWFADRGVDPARITARGAGESEPLASNDTPEGRRQNRRIQFFLENILG